MIMLVLLFSIGINRYALDCDSILEVIPRVNLKTNPSVPSYVAGLLNYGGVPVPVIDIAYMLENRASSLAMHSRIVLLKSNRQGQGSQYAGLICEKATTTIEVEKDKFIVPSIKKANFPFLEGVYTLGSEAIQFFNVNELLKMLNEEHEKSNSGKYSQLY
jgi:chemotaxis-related protein WspB